MVLFSGKRLVTFTSPALGKSNTILVFKNTVSAQSQTEFEYENFQLIPLLCASVPLGDNHYKLKATQSWEKLQTLLKIEAVCISSLNVEKNIDTWCVIFCVISKWLHSKSPSIN